MTTCRCSLRRKQFTFRVIPIRFGSRRRPALGAEVFVEVPVRKHQEQSLPRRSGLLALRAIEQRGLKRTVLVARRWPARCLPGTQAGRERVRSQSWFTSEWRHNCLAYPVLCVLFSESFLALAAQRFRLGPASDSPPERSNELNRAIDTRAEHKTIEPGMTPRPSFWRMQHNGKGHVPSQTQAERKHDPLTNHV